MDFATLRQLVLERRPALQKIIDQYGAGSFLAYARKRGMSASAVPSARQEELVSTFALQATRLFGSAVAERATAQLRADYYVSTAEHQAPVCHSYVTSGTILSSFLAQERGQSAVIVFPCSTISLNNSNFPRGVMYHDKELNEVRLPVVPWKNRHQSVFAAPPFTEDDVERLRAEPGYTTTLDAIFANERVLRAASFSDQVSLINFALWKKMPVIGSLDLLYIEQETMVLDLLCRFHLQEQTILHELLFNPAWHQSFLKHFDGLTGAFNQALQKGTVMFWGLADGVRVPLIYETGRLMSHDGVLSYELTPKQLGEALQKRELMPSLALSYLVLSFYYGLTLGGGSGQVGYLPQLRTAYGLMLQEMGVSTETFFETMEMSYLSSDFAFALNLGQHQTRATALDLLLYGTDETMEHIKTIADSVPLSLALDNLMPELYAFAHGGKQPVVTSGQPDPLPKSLSMPLSLVRQ